MGHKTAVGVDIGSTAIHVVELTARRDGVELTNFGRTRLPEGATSDGEVLKTDAVQGALRDLVKDMGLKAKDVWVGVSNDKVAVRAAAYPYAPRAEFMAALRYQVGDKVTMDADQGQFDFIPTDVTEDSSGEKLVHGLLVAALKTTVSGAVAAVSSAGLRPGNVDLNAFAVLRSLVSSQPDDADTADMLLDIGAGVTDVVVHDRGVPQFVRVLSIGGSDITDALRTGLSLDAEEAEQAKVDYGAWPEIDDATGRIVTRKVDDFVQRVTETLEFYDRDENAVLPGRILLSGGGSLLDGLDTKLSQALGMPVERARPFAALNVSTSGWEDDEIAMVEPALVTATGLALGKLHTEGVKL